MKKDGSRKDTEAAEAGMSSGRRKRRATEDTGSSSGAAIKTEDGQQMKSASPASSRQREMRRNDSGQRKRRATGDTGSSSGATIKTEGEHQKSGEAQAAIGTTQGMKTEADPHANLKSWVDRPPLGRPVSLSDLKRELVEARTARAGYYQVATASVSLVLRSENGGMLSCTLRDVIDDIIRVMARYGRPCPEQRFITGRLKRLDFHHRTLSTRTEDGQVLESEVVQIGEPHSVQSRSALNDSKQSVFDIILEDFTVAESHPIEKNIEIFVRTLKDKTIVLRPRPTDKIHDIKIMVEEKERIPPDQQRFVFCGKQLDEGLTLADYGVSNQATLHLMLRLRGGMLHPTSGVDGLEAVAPEKKPVLVTVTLGEATVEMDETTTVDKALTILDWEREKMERCRLAPSLLESVDELNDRQRQELIRYLTSRSDDQ